MPSRTIYRIALALLAITAPPPALPQTKPTQQQQLEERIKKLETRADLAERNATNVQAENDRIKLIQAHYESYYEKEHTTQMWTTGILIAMLTLALGSAGLFTYRGFEQQIKSELAVTSAKLTGTFGQMLAHELKELRDSNYKQVQELETKFQSKIETSAERIEQLSQYQFQFAQGLAFYADENWSKSIATFRRAAQTYMTGKPTNLISEEKGTTALRNLLLAVRRQAKTDEEKGKKVAEELGTELFKSLKHEVAQLALKFPWVAEGLKSQK